MHILFLKVVDQIEELLQPCDLKLLTETFKSLMASETPRINLFSITTINNLNNCSNAVSVLRYSSFLFTWIDHSILRALVSFNDKAVELLDEFDSSLDPLNIIVSYPIHNFSQIMIPSMTSEYTLLAIRCNRELWQCSLQYVFNIKSFIVEKCDITQHCLQLLAVKSDPTIFYWTIPKCIVELIKGNIVHHSEHLSSQGILEVSVYPKQSLFTGDDILMTSLAFTAEKEGISTRTLKVAMQTFFVTIKSNMLIQENINKITGTSGSSSAAGTSGTPAESTDTLVQPVSHYSNVVYHVHYMIYVCMYS